MIEIQTAPSFDREMKRLKKKYRSLVKDYLQFIEELSANPYMGVDLGNGVHKVRMAISSKGKGKSGGARIITHTTAVISIEEGVVTLLTIYDKAEQSTISDKWIRELLEE